MEYIAGVILIMVMIVVLNAIACLLMTCAYYIHKKLFLRITTFSVSVLWVGVFVYICYLIIKLKGAV